MLVKVAAIHVAKARKLPTREVPSVVAEAGAGLVGDRYHGTRHRHVTIQSQQQLDEAAAELGYAFDAGSTRRNITVDEGEIPTKPGTRLWIGDVELEVVRLAAPCRLLDDWIGPGAMAAMHGRGGSTCRLLSSGTISVGDVVEIEPRETRLAG
ncbi:sulfurase [Mycolicibacterium agri]|uniref:Sulfurase n=1 Tax=Mycolicibacterium agri TaxID=36811 RepID=A0A7I9W3I4_MYCAG|nr:sulfurase [Mycolicibacterium agri]